MNARPPRDPDYAELVRHVREIVDRNVPANRVVAVVSRGDDDLLRFKRHRGWHFPRGRLGLYAGHHPSDDADAVRQLEALREQGAGYLVLPRTADWWLDFYKDFALQLQSRFECIWTDGACRVYDLAPENPCVDAEPEALPAAEEDPEEWRGEPLHPSLVTVIVPVFNAPDELRECVESLVRNTPHPHQVLFIDDASPDARVWPYLCECAAKNARFRAARNRINLGYTATVNTGCRFAQGDVVLLNSDTQVTPGWLEKIAACAASREDVATVTPLSNAAGAFSVPENNKVNALPEGLTPDGMAAVVEDASPLLRPSVPTGNGFCMYITRRALREVGLFDARLFPAGYGEENDFCMRARAKGFVNLIDDATFIHHRNAASFGGRKAVLLERAARRLRELHPSYKDEVTAWLSADPLDGFREELAKRLRGARAGRHPPCLLTILHDGSGGTPHTNEDLLRNLADTYRCLALKAGVDAWSLWEYRNGAFQIVMRYGFPSSWRYHMPMDDDRARALRGICSSFGVRIAHVRHLLGSGPETVALLRGCGVPVVYSFHDYYSACPTIQLIDDRGDFCGGRCTSGDGPCSLAPSWFRGELPPLKHRYVHEHRRRMSAALSQCSAFVTTSHTARDILRGVFPDLRDADFRVIEHGRDLPRTRAASPPVTGKPARVVCPGNIDRNKGGELIERLLELDGKSGRLFEFHFLGGQSASFRPESRGGICHGRYERDELQARLAEIRPSFSLIASIWPETHCHTLTESWAAGIPVFGANLGAIKERVEKHGGGWLLDPRDADAWYEGMKGVVSDRGAYEKAGRDIERMRLRTTGEMAADYRAVYESCLAAPEKIRA